MNLFLVKKKIKAERILILYKVDKRGIAKTFIYTYLSGY